MDENSDKEIQALGKVFQILSELDNTAIARVLRYAASRFGATDVIESPDESKEQDMSRVETKTPDVSSFEDIADFFAATNPSTNADKALVASCWLQLKERQKDIDAYRVNKELNHLGHRVDNITQAFDSLINRKPQLAIQIRKTGSTQQARKKYRLTNVGIERVRQMLAGEHDTEG